MNKYIYCGLHICGAALLLTLLTTGYTPLGTGTAAKGYTFLILLLSKIVVDMWRKHHLGLAYFPNYRLFSDEHFRYVGKLFWG